MEEKTAKQIVNKRYEDKHKAERKAKNISWGTTLPREYGEEINLFLKKANYSKVDLIQAGYDALQVEYASYNTEYGKIKDGYDDFFSHEE